VTGTRFPNDVKHKPLRPPVSKNPRIPSPEPAEQEEHEIEEEGEEQQQPHQHGAAQGATGLTCHQDRSDRYRPEQHSHRRSTSSPIKKLINLFVGMCKSQRDIEVEHQR
jgi:hypothetical protein